MLSTDIILQARSPGAQPDVRVRKMPWWALRDKVAGCLPTVCRYLGWRAHCMFAHTYSIPEVWPGQSQHAVPVWLHPTL